MRHDTGRLALVGVLALVYALCYSTIKAGLVYAPPLRFAGLRSVGAGGALLVYLAVLKRGRAFPPRSTWAGTLALAVLGTVVLYGAMFMSPVLTGAGVSSVLGNTGPLFAVILAALFLGEPLTGRKAGALVVGLSGAALVAYPAVTDSSSPGVLAGVLPMTAAASAAGSAVLLKWLNVGNSLVPVAAWQLLLGGVLLLLLSAALEPTDRVVWSPRFAGYLFFLAVAGTAFALVAWYWLVQREDVGRLSILLMVLVPMLGLGFARVFFGEPIHPVSGVGVAFALAGLALAADERAIPRESAAGARQGRAPRTAGTGG